MTCNMKALGAWSWVKQPDTNAGLAYPSIRSFATTGSADATSVISTTLSATYTGADDVVGWIVECVNSASSQNIGIRRRILSYDQATGDATTDPFPTTVGNGDTFKLYQPPWAIAICDAAGTSGDAFVDCGDSRNEADDYWNGTAAIGGYYLEVVNAGDPSTTNHPKITDFVQSIGQIKFASATNLVGAPAAGDYFEIWKHMEVMNDADIEVTQDQIERMTMTGKYGKQASRAGLRSATANIELAFRGPGTGRTSLATEADEALSCVFTATAAGAAETTDAGSNTTTIVTTSRNMAVGRMGITAQGYAFMCTALSGAASYVVSPALGLAPPTGATVYGMRTYTPTTCLTNAMTLKRHNGLTLVKYACGAVPSPTFSGARGEWLKIALNFQCCDFVIIGSSGTEVSRTWYPRLPTVAPVRLGEMRAMIDGVSWGLRSFSFDPGLDIQPKMNLAAPNLTDGYEIVNDDPKGQIEVYYDSNTRKAIDDFLAGKEVVLFLQAGTVTGFPGVWALWCYKIRYTGPTLGDDAGQMTLTLPFQVVTDPTSSLPRWAIGTA